ncbi:MAG: hypothetical protein ACFBSE_00465 [Prochloraceae cyanobacterium]
MIARQVNTDRLKLAFEKMLDAYQTGKDDRVQLDLSSFEALYLKFLDETNIKNRSQLYLGTTLIKEIADSYTISSARKVN